MQNHIISDQYTLAHLNQQDAARLFQLVEHNRDHLSQWLNWVHNNTCIEDSQTFIQTMNNDFLNKTKYPYGIFADNILVGMIALNKVSRGGVNLTYWLDPTYQGKGIATRAAKYLTEFALTELGFHRVMIRSAIANTKSRAIPERLGFSYEGIARGDYWLNGDFVDIAVYSFLATDLQITHQT